MDFLLSKEVDKIILGCTHYPYLKNILIEYAGKDIFIDPSEYFADFVAEYMSSEENKSDCRLFAPEFYVSSEPEKFQNSSKIFYNVSALPKIKN